MSRYFLTTPIYYVTAQPHLGHAYSTITADALARWHRLLGDDVHFLTGTDEHGQKVADKAAAEGKDPQAFVDEIAPMYATAWERLGITNDDFIRTTEERHKIGVAELLQRCYDAGDIELDVYAGKYCVACEEYYTDDELDPGDLCRIHKRPVEYYEEENYFFRLIRGGLRDFSVSRTSLQWGIPLPWDNKHVAYVWFDALANYITAIGYGTDQERFDGWWPGHHLIGKDIIRHHCVYWPAMLMSAGIEPPAGWAVGGWLLVGGEKMSKTSGNVVNPLDLVDDVGVDAFRYYVLAETPYGQDGDFTAEGLVARYNSDLANNLGNLQARVATVVGKKCGGIGPAPSPDSPLAAIAAEAYADTAKAWDDVQPSRALEATWSLIRATNAHLESNEPWKAEPGPAVDAVMGDALEALRIVSILASPAVPGSAQAVWERIGLDGQVTDQRLPEAAAWGGYPGGRTVTKGDPLFPRR
jgi:methionyl-tRNA synthetase